MQGWADGDFSPSKWCPQGPAEHSVLELQPRLESAHEPGQQHCIRPTIYMQLICAANDQHRSQPGKG